MMCLCVCVCTGVVSNLTFREENNEEPSDWLCCGEPDVASSEVCVCECMCVCV